MRHYELIGTDGGTLPPHPWLKVGAIIRAPRKNTVKPGRQWNAETKSWVIPLWRECDDPTEGTS